jgi:hypothetical protein
VVRIRRTPVRSALSRRLTRENARRWRREIRVALDAFKRGKPCSDCGGVFDPVCMDFDHRPGERKRFAVGRADKKWETTLAEIAKCDLVCANCHRLRTHRLRDHRVARKCAPPPSTQEDMFR